MPYREKHEALENRSNSQMLRGLADSRTAALPRILFSCFYLHFERFLTLVSYAGATSRHSAHSMKGRRNILELVIFLR